MEAGARIRLLRPDQEVLSAAVPGHFRVSSSTSAARDRSRSRDRRESFSGSSMIPPRSPGLSTAIVAFGPGAQGGTGVEVWPARHGDLRVPLREDQAERFRRLLLVDLGVNRFALNRHTRAVSAGTAHAPDRIEEPVDGVGFVMKESTAWPSILAMALLLAWVEPAPCAAQSPAPTATAIAAPRGARGLAGVHGIPTVAAGTARPAADLLAAVDGVPRHRALREAERPGLAAADALRPPIP